MILMAASVLLTLVPAVAAQGQIETPVPDDAIEPVSGPTYYRLCVTVFVDDSSVLTCRTSCTGVNVIVLRPGACHNPTGPGCQGITVIVDSPQSCYGGPGKPGCVGYTIVDPFSPKSCVGGPGKKVYDLLLPFIGELPVNVEHDFVAFDGDGTAFDQVVLA